MSKSGCNTLTKFIIPKKVVFALVFLSLLGSVYPAPWSPDAMLPEGYNLSQDQVSSPPSVEPNPQENLQKDPLERDYLSEREVILYPDFEQSPADLPSSSNGTEQLDPKTEDKSKLTVIRGNPKAGKRVALTFDDGPYDGWTQKYMDVLESYGVKATFFLVGSRAEKFSAIVEDIAQRGFAIGGHSYSHSVMKNKSRGEIQEDFKKTLEVIQSITGKKIKLFRPPYGAYNEKLLEIAHSFDQITVTWNVDPQDWAGGSAVEVSRKVLATVADGSIILLHEGRENTWTALPMIIEGLWEKGYEVVSLSELLDLEDVDI